MDEINESDLLKTQMDLVNLSDIDRTCQVPLNGNDESPQRSIDSVRGFCVKEYEEEMQKLKKENFNLKLRIYFLEEKNPNVPEGAEMIYKQHIDLKIENQNLIKEVQEKQELLCQASKALELLDEEKHQAQQRHQMISDELNQKIESLQHEVIALQNAVESNKSNLGNDTGFTEFLGAVDSKDIELQKKISELKEIEEKFINDKVESDKKFEELKRQKSEIEMKLSNLLYENDEIKDKFNGVEKKMGEEITKLEAELTKFKDMWASAQCDLQDTEEKLQQSEKERMKTLTLLQSSIEELTVESATIEELKKQIASSGSLGMTPDRAKNNVENILIQKNKELEKLKAELMEAKKYIQEVTSQELAEKNLEIRKLQSMLKNMEFERASLGPNTRFSLEQLSESFNELKFQQAMEEKKNSQKKIDELMGQLIEVANTSTKNHVNQLQEQMKIVVEKQELTDSALGKCADLCGYTLDHLHELTRFLASLLQQKEFRESLDEFSLSQIQNVLERTIEFSQNPGRFSTVRGSNVSLLADISSLDLLMSGRQSLANVKSGNLNPENEELKSLQKELESAKAEKDDLNRVNQVLEDEILKLKATMQEYLSKIQENQAKLDECDKEIVSLKTSKDCLNSMLQESQNKIHILTSAHCELEQKLQEETIKKFDCEKRLDNSESIIAKLEEKLGYIQEDLQQNWISKTEHESFVKKLEDDIVNGEAHVAAVRMEMDTILNNLNQLKNEKDENIPAENKENLEQFDLADKKMLESTSRPESPLPDEAGVLATSGNGCPICPKLKARNASLKKYLQMAIDRVKESSEREKNQSRIIKKQLSSTESFLHTARTNMENILKTRNEDEN